jgi:hypothetical protein
VRAVAATIRLTDGNTVEVGPDDAYRMYLGHNYVTRMGQKRLRVLGGRNEFERWRQHQVTSWLAKHEDPDLPRVLIAGDSIRMRLNDCTGYGLYAYKLLLGRWNITHVPHNTGGSAGIRDFIEDWMVSRPDVVHFHAGLHDLAMRPAGGGGPKHNSPAGFRENLKLSIECMRRTPSVKHLIWGRITPVVDEWHCTPTRSLWRRQADVDEYNAVADELMREEDIEVNDIAAPIHAMGVRNGLLIDGVHLNPSAAAVLGRQVAERVDAARPR